MPFALRSPARAKAETNAQAFWSFGLTGLCSKCHLVSVAAHPDPWRITTPHRKKGGRSMRSA